MSVHQKMVFFLEKMLKAYFKTVILLIKTYENILKLNFVMGGWEVIRDIDCLGKCFKAVIYQCKKR